MSDRAPHADRFTRLRPLLFTIAYEILGSAADAEDVVQEAYVRWQAVDLDGVDDDKSYLATVVTRLALNAVRSRSRRREDYIGPWLPEPILLDEHDPLLDIELADSVSTAMLVVLETLGPEERAVFILREVFGFDYADIATMIAKSTAAVRQIAHRARAHVHARRPRVEPIDERARRGVVTEFLEAAQTGDVERLMTLLAPDVVWTADSDGKASATRRPVRGADRVARLLAGMVRLAEADVRTEVTFFNGVPGVVLYLGDELQGTISLEIAADGRIANLFAMRNPDKLGGIATVRSIAR